MHLMEILAEIDYAAGLLALRLRTYLRVRAKFAD